jgi:hypothetical protein
MPIQINGSGTITGITAGGYPDATVTADDLAATLDLSGKTVTLPSGVGGKLLQVRQTFKSDTFTTTSSTFTDLTGLSVSITPASTSNNILIFYYINGSNTVSGYTTAFRLVRNSTPIAVGDSDGNKGQATNRYQNTDIYHTVSTSASYLDSPGLTSSITYKVQIAVQGDTATINRTGGNLDTSSPRDTRPGSGIIVMEVAPNA